MEEKFTFKNHKISLLIALLPAAVVVFQSNRFWDLYDSSYMLDHSYWISLGYIPYKDFLLHTTPGTYLIQASIMKIFGFTLYPQIVYCCLISFLTYLLTYRILFFFNNEKWLNAALALPVSITGGYGILSMPFYDPDCVFFILFSLFLVLYCHKKSFPSGYTMLAGISAVLPALFKQNLGLVYLVMIHLAFLGVILFKKDGLSFKQYLWFFAGSIIALFIIILYISITSGINNFLFSTFGYAYKFRLRGPMSFLKQNFSLIILRRTVFWLLIVVVLKYLKLRRSLLYIICFLLLVSPLYLLPVLSSLFRHIDYFEPFLCLWPVTIIVCGAAVIYAFAKAKSYSLFMVFLFVTIIVVVNTSFLSQGYMGSTYALWPFLSILYALLFLVLSRSVFIKYQGLLRGLISTNSVIITLSVLMYMISNFKYEHIPGYEIKEKVYHSETHNLSGLSIPGEQVPNMDKLFKFVQEEIPFNEPIVFMPHEDPFYFATGRIPLFPYFIHDVTLSIYKPEEIVEKVRSYNVKWMIIKTITQAPFYGDTETSWQNLSYLISLLKKDFVLYKILPGYEIYRSG